MADLFYDPRDDLGAVPSDYTSRDDDPDIDHVPHNRHRYLTEAERQQIDNADTVEALADAAEKTGIPFGRLLEAWDTCAEPDDERYPSETERDWHSETAP